MSSYLSLKGPKHGRTDSEVMADLEDVFKSVDIDGEGQLDQASFMTALMTLGVQLSEEELEPIFKELDVEESGFIKYEQVLEFLQMGKIPSNLLNRVKKSKAPRKSIVIGVPPNKHLNNNNNNNKNAKSPVLSSPKQRLLQEEKEMNPQQLKMIQRAVIVIKKATMKNIKREEVAEFLREKGMNEKDIELAYLKAEEQVMSPEERIKYLQDLAEDRMTQINEQTKANKYLTNEMANHIREKETLRRLLRVSCDILSNTLQQTYQQAVPEIVADELKKKIDKVKIEQAKSEEMKEDRVSNILKQDNETLNLLNQYLTDKKYFHAYLILYTLDEVIRISLPHLTQFLSRFSDPHDKQNVQDIEYD